MPASSKTGLTSLVQGYILCARTEGKTEKTIEAVASSVRYLERFLNAEGFSTETSDIGPAQIRAFILYLQSKRSFSGHPFARPQDRGLSLHTINCYLRSVRAFWSWLVSEESVPTSPFAKVKIPKCPRKIVPTFSDHQLEALFQAIDTSMPEGFRDYVIILTLLDTALRVSELTGLRLENVQMEDGVMKVLGKGRKERLIPMGRQVQRLLWKYINGCRPQPLNPNAGYLFLTSDGRPLTKGRIDKRMAVYGQRAGISGVRCSPHTLRHTAAIRFLRNGGDVFSLQRMLGHSSLEMTRHYCELADVDVKRAHLTASPVDNLKLGLESQKRRLPA